MMAALPTLTSMMRPERHSAPFFDMIDPARTDRRTTALTDAKDVAVLRENYTPQNYVVEQESRRRSTVSACRQQVNQSSTTIKNSPLKLSRLRLTLIVVKLFVFHIYFLHVYFSFFTFRNVGAFLHYFTTLSTVIRAALALFLILNSIADITSPSNLHL